MPCEQEVNLGSGTITICGCPDDIRTCLFQDRRGEGLDCIVKNRKEESSTEVTIQRPRRHAMEQKEIVSLLNDLTEMIDNRHISPSAAVVLLKTITEAVQKLPIVPVDPELEALLDEEEEIERQKNSFTDGYRVGNQTLRDQINNSLDAQRNQINDFYETQRKAAFVLPFNLCAKEMSRIRREQHLALVRLEELRRRS